MKLQLESQGVFGQTLQLKRVSVVPSQYEAVDNSPWALRLNQAWYMNLISAVRNRVSMPCRQLGRITAMVPVASLAALISIGIGVDFSGQVIAEQQLRDQAAYCARDGAQLATLKVASTSPAVSRAYECLARIGVSGTVTLVGTTLVVTVSGTYSTKLLTIIAIDRLPLRGTASMEILPGR